MNTVCELNQCVGCMACVASCTKKAIKIEDGLRYFNAVIDPNKCVKCGLCIKNCQINKPVEKRDPIRWNQGWALDNKVRSRGTSGGFATAIMRAFINSGGFVCSCLFENGEFKFKLVDKIEQVFNFSGSKYIKSNPLGAYKQIKEKLLSGDKVLFIGLPCQVAGLKKYIGEHLQDKLYTVDLICHGTPSTKMLEKFLHDKGISLSGIQDIKFRDGTRIDSFKDYTSITPQGVVDTYTYSFLKQINYTENCYTCAYAKTARISDITLGDSWGSNLIEEVPKGISLALCQTEKGIELLEQSGLHLETVNVENAIENNSQLKHSATPSRERELFFNLIEQGKTYDGAVKKCFPKVFMRQDVKELLVKLKIVKRSYNPYRILYKKIDVSF